MMRPTLVLALLLLPDTALSQARDPAAGEALFKQGREAIKKKDYATACPKFAASQKLDPQPSTLISLAECAEHDGRLATAWDQLHTAIDQLPAGDDRLPIARDRMAKLDHRVPRLTVKLAPGAPAGTKYTRDGIEFDAATFGTPLPVNPGDHAIVVSAPGRKEARVTARAVEGQPVEVTVEPGEREASPSSPDTGAAAPPDAPPKKAVEGSKTLGYVALGTGIVGAGVAAVSGVILLGKKSTVNSTPGGCDQTTRTCNTPEAVDAAHAGTGVLPFYYGGLIVGVLGLGVGSYLLLSSGSDATVASVGPRGATVSGRF